MTTVPVSCKYTLVQLHMRSNVRDCSENAYQGILQRRMHQTAACCAQGFGYALSLLGFFWYNYIKMQPTPAPAYTAVLTRDTDGATKP